MSLMPRNADAILAARMGGLRPSGPVLVSVDGASFTDDDEFENTTVYVNSKFRYDWTWCRDLHLVVLVRMGSNIADLLIDIDTCEPEQTDVFDIERHTGWLILFMRGSQPVSLKWPKHEVEKFECGE
jgi:hypothetical protein